MIERQISYSGELDPCVQCDKKPLLFRSEGNKEKLIAGTLGSYYHFECPRCQIKTLRKQSIQEAYHDWEKINKVIREAA